MAKYFFLVVKVSRYGLSSIASNYKSQPIRVMGEGVGQGEASKHYYNSYHIKKNPG
jgi:hypothetical protein